MPHGKICYLEIPAGKAAQASAETVKKIEAAGGRVTTPRREIAP